MNARSWVIWITSLSLDAPSVVIFWQHAIAAQHGITIDWHHRVLVFSSVWLGYCADRWLDSWRYKQSFSQRHSFHATRRWSLLTLWIIVLGASLWFSVKLLDLRELRDGIFLALVSIIITVIIQQNRFGRFQRIAKSGLTAILVTSSVLIFAVPENTDSTIEAIIIMSSLFYLNCFFIHTWDHFIDTHQESVKEVRKSSRRALALTISLAMGASLFLLGRNPLAQYSITSIVLLLVIHHYHERLHEDTRRTLADIALLTPVLSML